ncbi:2228_t:CDS:2 [Cetraspora pellucida]|uniref:2228_t:CDS:1 n=1 Tax=Cetraspora pellucida TaxID=1433469 RepID=A0ACA9Q4W9_9GLOM|nr:2228_t:CDS:2 [Cetraspora pellucida]
MTDSKKPQEQTQSHPFETGDEISKNSKEKENKESKSSFEAIIEAGARTVALVDENVMMAMPELLEKKILINTK